MKGYFMKKKVQDDVIFAREKKRPIAPAVLLILFLLMISVVFFYNVVLNGHAVLLRQSVTVASLPSKLEGFRILHLSDLHGKLFGVGQENLLAALDGIKYQAVCVTGDITDKNGSAKALIRLIDQLPEDVPVFFVPGDEDPDPIVVSERASSAKASYVTALENAGAIFLDAPTAVTYNGSTVWFCPESLYTLDVASSRDAAEKRLAALHGEEPTALTDAQIRAAQYQLDRLDRYLEAQKSMVATDIHVALTHVPLSMERLRALHDEFADGASVYVQGVSLVLAGHYCAGQWRLPGRGALYLPDTFSTPETGFFPSDRGVVGAQSVLGVTQYISPGLASSSVYPFPIRAGRFFNQPAVTLITLTARMSQN